MDDDWYEKERLHRAASSGDVEEIKALLEEGLPINAFDNLSRTPLHYAASEGMSQRFDTSSMQALMSTHMRKRRLARLLWD